MTAAQKKVADNFKKALAIRKKTGCSLKDAFAKVYGKKTTTTKKAKTTKKMGSFYLDIEGYFQDSYEELLQEALDSGDVPAAILKRELKAYFKDMLKQVDDTVDYV
jgi:hypothetical protein